MSKYNRKVSRDKIRQALDEQIKDDSFTQGYNLYARTADGSKKIAENVVPDEVFAVSAFGEPAAVFYDRAFRQHSQNVRSRFAARLLVG